MSKHNCVCGQIVSLKRCVTCDVLCWQYDCDNMPMCMTHAAVPRNYCSLHKSHKIVCRCCLKFSCYDCLETDSKYPEFCKNCGEYVNCIITARILTNTQLLNEFDERNYVSKKIRNEMRTTSLQVCLVMHRNRRINDFRVISLFASRVMQFLHNFQPREIIVSS